jgi:hypothetical protein
VKHATPTLLLILTLASAASAQISVEEAYAKMRAKRAATTTTAPATTAPTTATAATQPAPAPDSLTSQIATLETPDSAATPTSPATRPDATRPDDVDLDDLHAQAVVLMRANRYDKARPLLQKVFDAKPFSQQSPSFVVNYCLLDAKQKANSMRAVKNLMDYFGERTESPGEKPVNLLAIALNNAVQSNPRVAQAPLFKAASARFEQLNAQLEATRPGYKRWGVEWVSPEDYRVRKLARDEAQTAYEKAAAELKQCAADVTYAQSQVAAARAAMNNNVTGSAITGTSIPGTGRQYRSSVQGGELASAQAALDTAQARHQRQQKLTEDLRRAIPQIPWPDSMDPIEP